MIRISIITICFNNPDEVASTCASVDIQSALPFEHWIINGSTQPAVREWCQGQIQPHFRKAIHERDAGIADAFNKGLAHATGDIILFLNSGDKLYDETVLHRVEKAFAADPPIQWLHGKVHLLRGGKWVSVGKPFEQRKLYRGMRSISHQTMYVRREVFGRYGGFDPSLRISMDYDFVCRIAGEKNFFLNYPLATYDTSGVSSVGYLEAMKEGTSVFQRYYRQPIKQALWRTRLYILYKLLNSSVGKMLYRIKAGLKLENM